MDRLVDSAAVLVHLKFILNIERQQRTSSSTVIINSELFPSAAAGKHSYINFQLAVVLYSLEGERWQPVQSGSGWFQNSVRREQGPAWGRETNSP